MATPHYVTRRSQLPAGAHAMFTAGKGYYAGAHPAIQPPPPKPKSQSVSQVANQRVNQQLAPVLGAQDAQATSQNENIKSFALALLGKLQGGADQVGANYDKAIGQTAALSGATADALRNANPNQQDQQLLSAINAPDAQRQQVQSKLADTFGGGAAALQFTQGEVPGSMLASQKASDQAQASKLPGIAALKGEQDLSAALAGQRQNRAQTLAQRPGLVANETQNIRQNNQARANLAWDQTKFNTARNDALGKPDTALSKTTGYYVNSQGQAITDAKGNPRLLPGWKMGPNGPVPPAKAGSTGSWRAIASGGGTYVLVNSKTGAQKVTDIPVRRTSAGKTVALQMKNIGGKVAYFNPKTGAITQTQLPYGSPKSKTGKSAGSTPYDAAFPHLKQAGVQHLQAGVAGAYKGVDNTGKKVTPATYQEAIDDMVQGGYSRPAATRMANRFYVHPWQRKNNWRRGMPGPAGG